ncbi:SubName: Full=Uncharacterized protein {ECO:0000313/EMBL:CCA71492.1} [Serendipita indica DSM 11827]|nr:SubName: Full=Uncharacterized protein {ECO:0000313/EMBL:CCA71492.1} [Serendipita indica DSM 11827]
MSQYPQYSSEPPKSNPDTRPLPDGWITQWDPNYKAWFYVNTRESPPRSVWVHPAGPPGSPQPQQYSAPSGAPPSNGPQEKGGSANDYYQGSSSPYPQGSSPYPQGPSPYPQQGQSPYPQQGYNQPNPSNNKGHLVVQSVEQLPELFSHGKKPSGSHGYGGHSQPFYGGQPGYGGGYGPGPGYGGYGQPQVVYQQGPKKSNMGRNAALAGGAGLLGGLLVADAIGDAYEDGYDQGYDGGDFDGGDFGGDF